MGYNPITAFIEGITAGIVTASKALIVDANKRLDTLWVGTFGAPIVVTASSLAVTAAAHAGRMIYLDRAAGCAVALPAPTASGNRYEFFTKTNISGGSIVFDVFAAGGTYEGQTIPVHSTNGTSIGGYNANASNTLTANGGSMGGTRGDRYVFTDLEVGTYNVQAFIKLRGATSSPWSTTA